MINKIWMLARSAAVGCGICMLTASCATTSQPLMPLPPETEKLVDMSDPQMHAVLEALHSMNPQPFQEITVDEARKQPTPADAVKKVMAEKGMSTDPEPVGAISSMTVPGPAGDIPVRVYTPQGSGLFPTLIYFHGGGWVIGSLDSYDASCRALTNMAHCVVVSVDYHLAPEHKFPAPTEDAYAATQYVMSHPAMFNADPQRITIGGESAGGNLAAVVCMMARDRGGMMPIYQLLIYPVTDHAFNTDSYRQNADAFPLDRQSMQWFFDQYLHSPAEGDNPYISILRSDVSKLPPATIITAEIDPLRSEGQAYAEKLRAAGVEVQYRNYKGVTHEFFGMGAVVDTAKRAEHFAAAGLQSAFAQ